jgi:hypothetical protein
VFSKTHFRAFLLAGVHNFQSRRPFRPVSGAFGEAITHLSFSLPKRQKHPEFVKKSAGRKQEYLLNEDSFEMQPVDWQWITKYSIFTLQRFSERWFFTRLFTTFWVREGISGWTALLSS